MSCQIGFKMHVVVVGVEHGVAPRAHLGMFGTPPVEHDLAVVTVRTSKCTHLGLGSFPFARRYLGNRCFFLFLSLLRCFSSGSSPPYVMYWRMDAYGLRMRVSPFRNLWLISYLHLTTAYRSLSRLSSALSAKASTLRSSSLYLSK